jgi:Arc/MetJ-type ribon-helix-helix transcriptional regulator
MATDHPHWIAAMNYNSIVCFRIDEDIDQRISRILGPKYATRSRFIRAAIERLLLQESEERLRAAQAAIRWG